MEFRILGPLEVVDGGRPLDLGRPKQRALLAALLVHANAVVSADRLVEELWAGRPPEDSAAALQVQVSRLRKVLVGGSSHEDGAGPVAIESRRPGYLLRTPPTSVDAQRFEALVAQAADLATRGAPARAVGLLDQALALWRGPALAEFADLPFAQSEAVRLEELRLVAQEDRVDAELALGRHAAVIGPLRQLAGDQPLRERLWGQLMVALYRCGRQAEALRAYAELRTHLGEELGIDPSPALQRLEEAVLLQSADLDWAPTAAAPAVAAHPSRPPFPLAPDDARSPFVGRDDALAHVLEEWRAARERGPRLVLLAGEPGVGKTRLAVEAALAAYRDGARVLLGRCDEELAVPYQPFAEALARVLAELAPEELDACVAGRGAELVRLVPELAELVSDLPEPTHSDPETERYRLFEAVSRTLAALSRGAPLVLIVDDLQWAAKPTVLLLRHLLTRAEPMPLLVVGTYRDTEEADGWRGPDLAAALGAADRVTSIGLTGLDEPAVAALVVAAGGEVGGAADVGLARALHHATAGNPFFVGEVMRNLAAEAGSTGAWSLDAAGVPEGVRSVVRQRLARLSEDANRLLGGAAVIGIHYHLPVLARAVDVDDDVLLGGLEEALAAGLVGETPGSPSEQRFTHALVRATLYDGLSAARRAVLHRRVGEAIETVHAGHLDDHLAELAHHFTQAATPGPAVHYSTRAGDRALALLAHEEAARHYRRALDLLPTGPGGDSVGDDAARCDLLLALGEAQRRSGDPDHRRTFLDAAQLAGRLGDAERLARAAISNSRGFWSATYSVDRERVAVLEAALDALPQGDGRLRACVLATLAVELVYADDTDGVRARSDEAVAIARRLDDPSTLAGVLIPRYNTLRGDPGTLPERLANTAELLAVTEALPDPSLRCQGWGWRALAAMEAADADEAARCFAAYERLSAELRQPTSHWYTTYLRAGRMLLAGRFGDAEHLSAEAFRLGSAAGHADAELFRSCQRIQLAYERGSLDRWERPLRVALARHPESHWFLRSWQALAFCEQDRPDEARLILDELAAKDFADLAFEPTWLHVVTNCAATCAQLGDRATAAVLYDLIAPYDGQFVTLSSLAYSGPVAHYLGALAAVLGDPARATAHFAAAAATEERMGAPAWLARTQLEWARTLATAGGGPDAAAEASALRARAQAAAADLGLATVARRAARLDPTGPA